MIRDIAQAGACAYQNKNKSKRKTDTSLRQLWETDLETFHVEGALQSGAKGVFKLQNAPEMEVVLSSVIENQKLTEEFTIPDMGTLYFSHQIEKISDNESTIKATILLTSDNTVDSKSCYGFLKQISDDIIDKAFSLKDLVER